MLRRIPFVILLGVLVCAVACTNKKVVNPLSTVGSKQPDKVLFDRAMDDMKHNRFEQSRLTLQALIWHRRNSNTTISKLSFPTCRKLPKRS